MFRKKCSVRISLLALLAVMGPATAGAYAQGAGPVTVTEDEATYTLDNGTVKVQVAKASGDLVSMRYRDLEMLAIFMTPDGKPDLQRDPPGQNLTGLNRGMTDHQYGFWSHDAMGIRGTDPTITKITIDPKNNAGRRGEVSVKGIARNRFMGTGPGARQGGDFAADIEIRYALGQGDSGVYTYCIFEHQADYPATSMTEARFCAKLNEFFDWLSAGDKYNKPYPKEQERGEDKYTYTTVQSLNPAFGWSSSTKKVGFYCINPSMEYMSGGPTKPEFLGHRDTNPVAAPCVLNYWRSSHYGGAYVSVPAGEHWTKVIGPFMLYVNSRAEPKDLYEDARAQAKKEMTKWPYDWVGGVDYPTKAERATVSGQLVLNDAQAATTKLPNLQVGLTHPPYQGVAVAPPPARGGGFPGRGGATSGPATGRAGAVPARGPLPAPQIDWQTDAKYYEFWARGNDDGTFAIPNVRAGSYTLHAFADGVLGEFAKADVTVESAKPLDLGKITWTPVRRGKQLWDIGIPNRNGSEFFKAEDYAAMDIVLQYAKLFPNDITYTIGKSDFRKDWFYAQVPHNTDPNPQIIPIMGIRSSAANATPWSIVFDLPSAPRGRATLRAAISGTGARSVQVTVNDQPAGQIANLPGDGAITRHQIQGIWVEREVPFDATLMKQGANKLTLTVSGGSVTNGVIYDYLRLELDENAP